MNIGILTLQYPNNYGAMLQAYSLQCYLKGNLHNVNVDILNFLPEDYFKNYSFFDLFHLQYYKNYIERFLKIKAYSSNRRKFDSFRSNYLALTQKIKNESVYSSLVKKYDYVVYGSDQIWNNEIGKNSEVYFGKYVDASKRLSYAASFGFDSLNSFQVEMIEKYIINNHGVSCREFTGTNEISKHISGPDKEVYTVCDPVFLTSKGKWEDVISKAKIDNNVRKPYILYYCLSKNKELNILTKALHDKTGEEIICIHPLSSCFLENGVCKKNVGPIEFLILLSEADFICTDSFHALCFSIIFGKKVLAVPSKGKGGRLIGLLKRLEDYKMSADSLEYYDMNNAIEIYEKEIQASKSFLLSKILS